MRNITRNIIMGITLTSLFTGFVVYWFRRDTVATPLGNDGFIDVLASSPPTRSRTELAAIIHTADYGSLNDSDLVLLLQEAVLNFIKPHMEEEDTIHVKSEIIPLLIRLQTNISSRIIREIESGGGGEESTGNSRDKVKGAQRNTNGSVQHLRGVSGQPISSSNI